MGLGRFFKKLVRKFLPLLPIVSLFVGGGLLGSLGRNVFGFVGQGAAGFFKKNIFKALLWGYGIYSALNPKKPPTFSGAGDYSDEPVYSWDGGRLTSQANIPVQLVYGEWWINNANVIDREITSKKSIDPKNSKLVFKSKDMNLESENITTSNAKRRVVNITNIETGSYVNTLVGFEINSGRHVYYENHTDGWQFFDEVSLHTNRYGNNLITRWHTLYKNNLDLGKAYEGIHYKFVFTPNDGEIYSFMTYEFAPDFMVRLDVSNKTVYYYRPFGVLLNDSNSNVFDWCEYDNSKGSADYYLGFATSTAYNTNQPHDKKIANNQFYFHISDVIKNYTSSTAFTYSNIYTSEVVLQSQYFSISRHSSGQNQVEHYVGRDYNQSGNLSNFYRSSLENGARIKYLDAVIHFHEGHSDFSLQVLVDDSYNNTTGETADEATGTNTSVAYSVRTGSNSHSRYVIGLTGEKLETLTPENLSGYGVTDIVSKWNSFDNQNFRNAVTNRHFFGLFGRFLSSSNASYLYPTDKQTEIFNLAYLSYKKEPYEYSNPNIDSNETDKLFVQPYPSRFASYIYRDRTSRIEYFAHQPQFTDWQRVDPDDDVRIVNKSIGAIVSHIVYTCKKVNPIINGSTNTVHKNHTKLEPRHISYSFFSCICRSVEETDHRFDPFFVEIANFSGFNDLDPNSTTKSTFTRKNPNTGQFNVTKSDQQSSNVQTKHFATYHGVGHETSFGTKYEKIGGLDGGRYWGVTGNNFLGNPRYGWLNRGTKAEQIWDQRMDRYLYSSSDDNTFFNFNNQLSSDFCLYVPARQYTLVRVDNSFIPIRGWNQKINWVISEIPTVILPDVVGSYYYYAVDGDSAIPGASKTSVWQTLNLWQTLGLPSYSNNTIWFRKTQNKVGTLNTGFVSDMDGQMQYGMPKIIEGSIYWVGQNSVFLNVSDNALNSIRGITTSSDEEAIYISSGYWGEFDNAKDFYNSVRVPAYTNTGYGNSYSTYVNNYRKESMENYGSNPRVVYEPVVLNEEYRII